MARQAVDVPQLTDVQWLIIGSIPRAPQHIPLRWLCDEFGMDTQGELRELLQATLDVFAAAGVAKLTKPFWGIGYRNGGSVIWLRAVTADVVAEQYVGWWSKQQ